MASWTNETRLGGSSPQRRTTERNRDRAVRRLAKRLGYRVWKPRGIPSQETYGPYALIHLDTNTIACSGLELDELERSLMEG